MAHNTALEAYGSNWDRSRVPTLSPEPVSDASTPGPAFSPPEISKEFTVVPSSRMDFSTRSAATVSASTVSASSISVFKPFPSSFNI